MTKKKSFRDTKQKDRLLLFFLFLFCSISFIPIIAQNRSMTITGIVVDEKGEALVGVNIIENGSPQNATITNVDGKFTLRVSSPSAIISFTYIGYFSRKLAAEKVKGEVILIEDIKSLEEVLVVGYGTQKKETVTGALASVAGKDLLKSPVANVSNALAGRLPGVSFVQRSGEPGNDQSIIKIRGMGTMNDSSPLIIVDGVERSSMEGIDMNEIESVNVLKDAAMTAVYGIRGANGVIILTTKVGRESKPTVSFSVNTSVQTPTIMPDFLNSYDYAVLKNEAYQNDYPGNAPLFTPLDLEILKNGYDPIFYPNTERYKTLLKDMSFMSQYNANVTGGTKMVRYFVSLGYLTQDGQYDTKELKSLNLGFDPNPRYNRYNVRSNFDIQMTKDFSASIKMGNQIENKHYSGNTASDIFFNLLQKPPMSGVGVVDGKLVNGYINDPLSVVISRGATSASSLASNGYVEHITNTFNINVALKYDFSSLITKGLTARAMYAYDHYYRNRKNRQKAIDTYSVTRDPNTNEIVFIQTGFAGAFTYSEDMAVNRVEYFESALEYDRTFDGKHKVGALLLYNQRKVHDHTLAYSVPAGMQGLVGRATYSYNNKYLGEFSMGYNGSENFPIDRRYGFFPAFSLGWILSEESFFPKNDYLNYVKLRGSYGETGNDKLGSNRFLYLLGSYEYSNATENAYMFGTTGLDEQRYGAALEGKIGNKQVTWERAIKQNYGIDLYLFKSKLNLIFDYFAEKRNDILIDRQTVPSFSGIAALPAANLGKVQNNGFEVEFKWRDKINNFEYYFGGNFTYSKNKILHKEEATKMYPWMMDTGFSIGQQKAYKSNGFYNYLEEVYNRPFYSFYGNKVQQGDLKYIDIDGDGIIDQKDVIPVGFSDIPEIGYGINLGGNWKNLDFSVLFQGTGNVSIFQREMIAVAFHVDWYMTLEEHKNRWTQERFDNGEKITMPRLSNIGQNSPNGDMTALSDFWNKDAKYLRLKNLEIGYTLPKSMLNEINLQSLRIYANGSNLFTLTSLKNYDPESPTGKGLVYPQMAVFNVGLNIKF